MSEKPDTNAARKERSFAPGEFIFEEGKMGDFAYVLESGKIEICKLAAGGEYKTLQEIGEGTLFGEMALIDKSPRSASARAINDVVVREVDDKALMAHIKRTPEVAMNMMYRLASYVRTSNKSLEGSVFGEHGSEHEQAMAEHALNEKNKQSQGLFTARKTDIDHIINEFQPAHVEIERSSMPPIILKTFWAITMFIIAIITWASFSIIDTTVSARGRLSTTIPTIDIQATDNSVVKIQHVIVGQQVSQGEPLVTLDETFTMADLSRVQAERDLLKAKIQRLEAELNKQGLAVVETISNNIERGVYINRQNEYSSRISSLNIDIEGAEQKLETTTGDVTLASKQLEIKKQLEEAQRTLFDQGIGAKNKLLEASNQRLSAERDYRTLLDSLKNLESSIKSLKATKQAFVSEWFSSIGVELSSSQQKIDGLDEELIKLHRKEKNIVVHAPADGVIMQIENLHAGTIVNEGAPIMSLVPSNVPLIVDLDINPRDIGNLIHGTSVSIKLDALPYQKHGDIIGELTFISEDTVDEALDGEKGTFYRARSAIMSNELKNLPDNARLVPGMLLTADIKAGRRRLITYFIYPVIRTIQTSFSEP
jgi:hemolysin D